MATLSVGTVEKPALKKQRSVPEVLGRAQPADGHEEGGDDEHPDAVGEVDGAVGIRRTEQVLQQLRRDQHVHDAGAERVDAHADRGQNPASRGNINTAR